MIENISTNKTTLSFDLIPAKLEEISSRIDCLTALLSGIVKDSPNQAEELLGVKEAAKFLGLKPSTIYAKTHKLELPFMKSGKKIYFSKRDLLSFLKAHKVDPNQIELKANAYLSAPKQ